MCWVIMGLGCKFHFGTSQITWRQECTIALQYFNVRVSWRKIVDNTAWNFKFQKSCFSLSENLFIYIYIYIHFGQGVNRICTFLVFLCFQQSLMCYTLESRDLHSSIFGLNTSLHFKQFSFIFRFFGLQLNLILKVIKGNLWQHNRKRMRMKSAKDFVDSEWLWYIIIK